MSVVMVLAALVVGLLVLLLVRRLNAVPTTRSQIFFNLICYFVIAFAKSIPHNL